MITGIGANSNFVNTYSTRNTEKQKHYTPSTLDRRKEAESVLASQSDQDTDIKSLYEAEQTSTFFRIEEQQKENDAAQSKVSVPRLTKEDLTAIETGLNASDDPRRYYDAAFDLFIKGVLKTEDAPKLFELCSATGEIEIVEGGLPDIDFFGSMEEPGYIENLVKTVLARLKDELEIPLESERNRAE
ncbi:hypothetical protein FRZ06_05300 [Anoxybacterium hadale]|uniref:Uncharacterized protein n=1 Tax=Anoxybacterium hadale TaxID=3408580 RepID=A0ACD1A8W7_9FIRM|nr:hypothetical protein FRZ06_05300 [Clostridiales bacterium]